MNEIIDRILPFTDSYIHFNLTVSLRMLTIILIVTAATTATA